MTAAPHIASPSEHPDALGRWTEPADRATYWSVELCRWVAASAGPPAAVPAQREP